MQRVVWLGYLSLVLAVPLGIGLGSTVGHPGDPPHIFTLLAVVAGGLALAGALREVADPAAGRASRVLVSGGLACFIAITTMSEPFLNFDGSSLKGLLPPSSWLVPVAAAGVWFVSQRRWPQVAAAMVFLAAGAALMTFNMHWRDPAGFVSRIRS